jgi:5-methylcytosine-specific restriction endonuclease McrA
MREPLAADDPKRGRGGREWQQLREEILVPGALCWLCGVPIDINAPPRSPRSGTLDHVRPLSKGGHPTDRENVRAACHSCNSGRGNRDPAPRPVIGVRVRQIAPDSEPVFSQPAIRTTRP